MSSQNYLSNVFRQVYTYSNGQFIPTLNISNVSKITADSLTVTTLSLGGTNDNLYFGDGAGSINANSRDNVAIGVAAANNISNTSNSVFLGRSAGAGVDGADTMISIGMGAKGNGISNIYIGKDTGAAAASSSNIFIGHSLDTSLAISNTLLIGQDGDTLITGNFSNKWLGIGTSTPTSGYKFDVSGNTNIAGALNVTGNLNAGSLSVSAVSAPYSRLSNGTILEPSYSFVNDTSMGMYMVASNTIGFAYAGQQSMCISGSLVGINTPTPRTALDVSGDISANRYNGPNGTASAPKYTFSSDLSTGVFLASNGALSFTAGGVKQLTITSNGVVNDNPSAVTTNPILRDYVTPINYDISGGNILVTKTVSSSNFTGIASASNSIGGVTLSNSNVSGVVTTTTSNVLANGYLRNALIPTQFDISGGNISNSGTTRSSNFMTASSSSSNVIGGITMSSGRIAAGTTTSNYIGGITLSNFSILTNPTTSNTIGGVILSNSNIALDGAITGTTANTSNQIGGVILSNSNVSFGGAITGTTATTSNNIGGITLSNNNIAMSGTIVGSTANTSNNIGGVTLSNNNIAMSGTIVGSTANTSNNIGGVTLSNNNISNSAQLTTSNIRVGGPPDTNVYAIEEFGGGYDNNGTGVGASPAMAFQYRSGTGGFRHFIRARHDAQPIPAVGNALDFFINGTNTSNGSSAPGTGNVLALSVTATGVGVGTSVPAFNLDVSGNIRSTASTSNNIGGVTLSNNNIAMSGTIIGSTANTSNNIGGVTLSNGNLNASTLISGSGSNLIGGVTLSNYIIRDATRISTIDFAASGYIRNNTAASEFDISGGNISNSGRLTSSNIRVGAPVDTNQYAIQEIGGGTTGAGIDGSAAIAFQRGGASVTGGFRHFIRSRHSGNTTDPFSNSLDFFLNNAGASTTSTAPGTGNTLAMSVTAGGVGIGMSNPEKLLDISSATTNQGIRITAPNAQINLSNNGTSGIMQMFNNGANSGLFSDIPLMTFWTGANQRMCISGANVGIGTRTPGATLDLSGNFRLDTSTGGSIRAFIASSTYGNFAMNGYFTVSRNNTNIGSLSNENEILTLLAADTNTTNYFMSNKVGIGTRAAAHLLDVNGGQGGTTTIRVYSGSDVAGSATNIPRIRLTSRVGTGSILDYDITGEEVNTTNNYGLTFGGYGSANVFRMDFGNKRLGVGTVAPAYALDVSAGTTAASINMSSWPRMSSGCAMMALGSVNRTSSVMNWSNASISMNTELLTFVASNATNGSYFVIKKSGIWSIKCVVTNQDGAQYASLDASTNIGFGGHLNDVGKLAQSHTSLYGDLTYVGYLSSNSGMYYKIIAPSGEQNSKNAKILITFISEMPDISPTFPPP
jgi:hypothetical protein